MPFRFIDRSKQVENSIVQKSSAFLREVAEEIIDTARPITPASASNPRLRNDALKQVLGLRAIIKWNKSYAAYQERGMRIDGSRKVRNYTTPGTGKHFAKRSVQQVLKRTRSIAKRVGLIL